MYKYILLLFLTFSFGLLATPDYIQQAIQHPQRLAADKAADKGRQPQQVLTFFDLKPGMTVLDLFSGAGYYTELTSYVVGENGRIDAHNNQAYIDYIGEERLQQRFQGRLNNTRQVRTEAQDINFGAARYDRVLMILTFHDLYYENPQQGWPAIDDKKLMKSLLQALKPGGIIGIVDHAAPQDSGEEMGNKLHRISAKLVKQKMQNWGFKYIAEADFLHNPDDPLNIPMWDPKVKGKTHRFVMKFSR